MKVSNVPFKGTAEQETELRKRIAEHKGEKGSLMPIMQAAQEIYGYLPYQVQKIISARLDWGAKESQVSRLFADLTKKLQTRIEGAQHQKEILSTEEEYYDPYYGGIWEEDPSDPLFGEDTPL